MVFSSPAKIPSFTNPNRTVEDRLWGAASAASASPRGSRGGAGGLGLMQDVSDQVGNFFLNAARSRRAGNPGLPMYKDKPYSSYATAARRTARSARNARMCKGIIGAVIFVLLMIIYLLGTVGRKHAARLGGPKWAWLKDGAGDKIDWAERRQSVVEAFELSWDAYAENGWGER